MFKGNFTKKLPGMINGRLFTLTLIIMVHSSYLGSGNSEFGMMSVLISIRLRYKAQSHIDLESLPGLRLG